MSLVGSLEDLGLGEILQIIHLSRKSGVLLLRCEAGEGQILFHQGLIRGTQLKGGPTDLRELLAKRDLLNSDEIEALVAAARAECKPLGEVLVERGALDAEQLEDLRRDHVESAVLTMFEWLAGDFSFEVRPIDADPAEDLFLLPGINPQFLVLEGTRQLDEATHGAAALDDGPAFDGEPVVEVAGTLPPEAELQVATEADEPVALGEMEMEADGEPAAASPAPEPREPPPAIVVIDPQLPVIEWVKEVLAEVHPRVHIFQHTELGIARIRQYLARAEIPLVLIGAGAPADPLSGARDCRDLVRRLQCRVPQLEVVMLVGRDVDPKDASAGDEWVPKPTLTDLADARAAGQRGRCAAALLSAARRASPLRPEVQARSASTDQQAIGQLREVSARIQDPSSRGEVLTHVLSFAARHFSRVAMFMVRADRAIGLAQVGLARAGGPEDADFRCVELPHREPAWFRSVLDGCSPVRSGPKDPGDQHLAVLLGNEIPEEAYLAPIESGGGVVALLYADNLPGREPVGDTSMLEVVLHEAGLALDRAVLERALAEAQA